MSDIPALSPLGCSPRWQAPFAHSHGTHVHSARVVLADRGGAQSVPQDGLIHAKHSTAPMKLARGPIDLPVLGDRVVANAPHLERQDVRQ